MIAVERLKDFINRMERKGDQQPMRDAMQLMRHHGVTVAAFAATSEKEKVELIEWFVTDMKKRVSTGVLKKVCRVPVGMFEPSRLARRIAMGFYRLSRQFPADHLPAVEAPPDRCVHPAAKGQQLLTLKREIDGWTPRIRGEKPGIGQGKPMTVTTVNEYRMKIWQLATFANLAGLYIGRSTSLEMLTEQSSVGLWLPLVRKHYTKKGISPFLAAIKRVTADVLGYDHPNVAALSAARRTAFQDPALSTTRIDEMRDLTRPEEAIRRCQIWEVPAEIDKLANAARLAPADRNSRRSCATAAEIALCALSLAPEHLAAVNLQVDIAGEGYERTIRCTDVNGQIEWRKLSERACDRIDALMQLRLNGGRPSPWLFPNKNGHNHQTRQIAMAALARNISAALRCRLRVVDLRDALMINAIDSGVSDAKLIAEAAGVKDARWIERRYGGALKSPLHPAAKVT